MASGSSLSQRILEHYDAVPRGERRLADLLLAQPAAVRHHSATELAARVGVSKATAARLFRRLGYPSFRAARFEARGAVPTETAGVPATDLGAHLEADVQNLVKTIEHQRSDTLARALRALAHVARAFLIRVRPDIRMLPIGGPRQAMPEPAGRCRSAAKSWAGPSPARRPWRPPDVRDLCSLRRPAQPVNPETRPP